MPSLEHEAPIHLFKGRPALAADLVRVASGASVVPFHSAHIASADFSDLEPRERRADLVVVLAGEDGEPRGGVVVEIQRDRDPQKIFRWPLYLAALHDRLRCNVYLVVLTFDPIIAEWARQPIATLPNMSFAPLVVEPGNVPAVTSTEEAARNPELAVLSALMHPREEVVRSALEAVLLMDDPRAADYVDIIAAHGGQTARVVLEALMSVEGEKYFSDFARRYYDQGRAEGKAEGRVEGKAEGKVSALLSVLQARGIALSPSDRERVESCEDEALLDLWITRAAVCQKKAEVFE